jgi:hypothetical protein
MLSTFRRDFLWLLWFFSDHCFWFYELYWMFCCKYTLLFYCIDEIASLILKIFDLRYQDYLWLQLIHDTSLNPIDHVNHSILCCYILWKLRGTNTMKPIYYQNKHRLQLHWRPSLSRRFRRKQIIEMGMLSETLLTIKAQSWTRFKERTLLSNMSQVPICMHRFDLDRLEFSRIFDFRTLKKKVRFSD